MSAWHTVHVRVNDSATGQPTPVRISFQAADRFLPPLGRMADFPVQGWGHLGGHLRLGNERFWYIDGTCEVRLPPGAVTVTISKGPEYRPVRQTVNLVPGQISLRFQIERWTKPRPINLHKAEWFAVDSHVLHLSPHEAALEAAGEGITVVNLLACERPSPIEKGQHRLTNLLAFSGQSVNLWKHECEVVVNTLNWHPLLGTLALLNSHRAIYPLRFGGDLPDDWTLADWCDQCHRKKTGLVVWSDDRPRGEQPRLRGEALADLILGRVDAFEITGPEGLDDWYTLLNAGLRVPLVGGSGKDGSDVAVGAVRTYAHIRHWEGLFFPTWIKAVRKGPTFVTSGPLLSLTVGRHLPGSVVPAEPGGRVGIHATARAAAPFGRLEVLVNGKVVASDEGSGDLPTAEIRLPPKMEETCWVAARCIGESGTFAQTSPVYVEVAGQPFRPAPAAVESLAAHLDHTLEWVRREARCPTEKHRDDLAAIIIAARRALTSR